METLKIKIVVLWVAVICGFALHTLADLLPLFWGENITIEATGNAPAGLLAFMMAVSYLIPVIGILCVLYGCRSPWHIGNALLIFIIFLNIYMKICTQHIKFCGLTHFSAIV